MKTSAPGKAFYPPWPALSRPRRGRRCGVSWPIGQLNITVCYAKCAQSPAGLAWWSHRLRALRVCITPVMSCAPPLRPPARFASGLTSNISVLALTAPAQSFNQALRAKGDVRSPARPARQRARGRVGSRRHSLPAHTARPPVRPRRGLPWNGARCTRRVIRCFAWGLAWRVRQKAPYTPHRERLLSRAVKAKPSRVGFAEP